MENNFGEILKQVIEDRGWTITKFSDKSNISRMHLYRIINNKNEPTLYVLNQISSALKVDIGEYYKVSQNFNSIAEYKKFKLLRERIEHKRDISIIEALITDEISLYQENNMYVQLLNYSKALVECEKYKNYTKSLVFCYKALDIDKESFIIVNLEKYIISEVSFNVISLIEYNYYNLKNRKMAKEIAEKLIKIIDKIYFSEEIPNMSIPKMVYRVYIAMHNNLADILFADREYKVALNFIEKGIAITQKYNSLYGLKYLYDLSFQSYYNIDELDKAKMYYEKAKAICIVNDDFDYLARMEERVEKNYAKIKYEVTLNGGI